MRGVPGIRPKRVPLDVFKHFGELDPVGKRQEQGEDVRTADHGHWIGSGQLDCIVEAAGGFRARREPVPVAGHDDVTAPGKKAGKAIESAPAHDHRTAHGQRLEALEVGGDVPRQLTGAADHAIASASDDDGDWRPVHGVHFEPVARACQAGY